MSKTLVIVGTTGDGKSTFGNVLRGLKPNEDVSSGGFLASGDATSCTRECQIETGSWFGDATKAVRVIDTPGRGDGEGAGLSEELRLKVVNCLKSEKTVDAFIWVKNAARPRFTKEDKSFVEILSSMIGEAFVRNTVIVLSRWHFDEKSIAMRQRAGGSLWKVKNELFRSIGGAAKCQDFPIIPLDALFNKDDANETRHFMEGQRELWTAINGFKKTCVADANFTQTVLGELTRQLKNLQLQQQTHRESYQAELRALREQPSLGYTGLYYCGKHNMENNNPPFGRVGVNGHCGPTNGPNCPSCRVFGGQQIRTNDQGRRAVQGTTGLFYCGAKFSQPFGFCDGYCGPNNGPNCPSCFRLLT